MIVIVDYGMGNIGSIVNMFRRLHIDVSSSADPKVIADAEKLLLPGVGAFDAAMERINSGRFRDVLESKATKEKVPVLGICLGMQLITESSEEGHLPGLGWIPAKTLRFDSMNGLKVPHMGWNSIHSIKKNALLSDLGIEPRFYFVHSYYVLAKERGDVLARTTYGVEFDSVVNRGNIFGAQFHPEKSHMFGMKLLANFAAL